MPSFLKATRRTYYISLTLGLAMFVLCFVAGRQTSGQPRSCKDSRYYRSKVILDSIEHAIEDWRKDHDGLPESLNLLIDSDGLVGEYYIDLDDGGSACDFWYNPIVYEIEGDDYELISYGEDGKPGGIWFDSDISNRKPFPPESFSPSLKLFLFSEFVFPTIAIGLLSGGFCFLGSLWVLREEVPPADLSEEKSAFTIRNVFSVLSKLVGIVGIILFSVIIAFALGAVHLVQSGH